MNASPWSVSYSIGATRHFADLRILQDGATVVSRLLVGDNRDDIEKQVAKFLESDEARKVVKLYTPK